MSAMNPKPNGQVADKEMERAPGYDEVPGDDRIIARAFKHSLLVIVLAALGIGAIWLALRPQTPPQAVQEAPAPRARSLAEALPVAAPPIRFTDVTREAGIDFVHVNGAYGERLLPETMGGGVAFLDYDRDGRQDLLFVNSSPWPWRDAGEPLATPALYRNLGGGRFANVTQAAGLGELSLYGMGVAAADLDADGYPELFLTAVGSNRLLHNLAGKGFEDITGQAGVAGADDAWSTGASFFDYDADGDLDLFVANYVRWSRDIDLGVDYRLTGIGRAYGPPTNYPGSHSYLYRNRGDGTFEDVSASAGIQVTNPATGEPAGKAMAVLPLDADGDGWTDLLVANDTVQNFLFRNRGDGTFEEIGAGAGVAFDNAGMATGAMGMDTAMEGGERAIAVGNFANQMTSFYVSRDGDAFFSDEAIVSGVGAGSRRALSFGVLFLDADLDGRLDLIQSNGHVEDEINLVQTSQHYEQPAQLFWGCGSDCLRRFVQVPTEQTGALRTPVVGRGLAYADYDQDGDLDLVITQVNRRPLLLRNDQALGYHWLRVKVRGRGANRDALGARVTLVAGGVTQERVVTPNRSYLSQVELPLTFGLGATERVERLEVTWADGARLTLAEPPIDRLLVVRPPDEGQ
jgi:hypothetical protein